MQLHTPAGGLLLLVILCFLCLAHATETENDGESIPEVLLPAVNICSYSSPSAMQSPPLAIPPPFCNCFPSPKNVSYREGGRWISIDHRINSFTSAQGFTELMQNMLDRVMVQTRLSPSMRQIESLKIETPNVVRGVRTIQIRYSKTVLAALTLHCDTKDDEENEAVTPDENATCNLFLTNYQTSFNNELLRNGHGGKEKKSVNSNQAGQFGEGMKVGICKLLQDEYAVMYFQNRTIWEFSLHRTQPHYKGDPIDPDTLPSLHFRELLVSEANSTCNSLTVQISATRKKISAIIEAVHDRFLHFKQIDGLAYLLGDQELPSTFAPAPLETEPILKPSHENFISHRNGDALLDLKERGRIYVNGLLVHTERALLFGYNVVNREVARSMALTADRNQLNPRSDEGYKFLFSFWESAAEIIPSNQAALRLLLERLNCTSWAETLEAAHLVKKASRTLARELLDVFESDNLSGLPEGQFWNTSASLNPPPLTMKWHSSMDNDTHLVLMPHGWAWGDRQPHTEALRSLLPYLTVERNNIFTFNISAVIMALYDKSGLTTSEFIPSVLLSVFRKQALERKMQADKLQKDTKFWDEIDSCQLMPNGYQLPTSITSSVLHLLSTNKSAVHDWNLVNIVVVDTKDSKAHSWLAERRINTLYVNHNLIQMRAYQAKGSFTQDVALIARLVCLISGSTPNENQVMNSMLTTLNVNQQLHTFHRSLMETGGAMHPNQTPAGVVGNVAAAFESKPFVPSNAAKDELESMTASFATTFPSSSQASHPLGGRVNVNYLNYSPDVSILGRRSGTQKEPPRVHDADNDDEWIESAKMIPIAVQPRDSYRVWVPKGSAFEIELPAKAAALAANLTSLLSRELMPRVQRYLPFPTIPNLPPQSLAWHPYLFYANHSVSGRCHSSQLIGYNLAQFEAMLQTNTFDLVDVFSTWLALVTHEIAHAAVAGSDRGIDGGHGINFSRMMEFAFQNLAAEMARASNSSSDSDSEQKQ